MEKVANKGGSRFIYHNLRFERKFVYDLNGVDEVIKNQVLTNRFNFDEIYERRTVNNIYFDDWNHTFYKMNVSGDAVREKYRLRWYDDIFHSMTKPTLEIKKKYGEVGDKYSCKLTNLDLDLRSKSIDDINSHINECIPNEELLVKFNLLFPTLYNSYERRYFLSKCEKFRITIDYNMTFYNPNYTSFYESKQNLGDIILELKYDTDDDMESRAITQSIKERLSKNSKYVRGYDIFYK
ncbi:polyphosphate polymerase domain-containing protein [Croceitalea sp. MTPC5]|uniref:polyphosphate polymerase domain-containing protein n=1 Tax=Croceitalea sp. MTPC5 TaxID=3056565 RepID=UPI002B36A884|nr:polyphosphate polymerase domain-containing protein [Croceitalea sp. MTPC5]